MHDYTARTATHASSPHGIEHAYVLYPNAPLLKKAHYIGWNSLKQSPQAKDRDSYRPTLIPQLELRGRFLILAYLCHATDWSQFMVRLVCSIHRKCFFSFCQKFKFRLFEFFFLLYIFWNNIWIIIFPTGTCSTYLFLTKLFLEVPYWQFP